MSEKPPDKIDPDTVPWAYPCRCHQGKCKCSICRGNFWKEDVRPIQENIGYCPLCNRPLRFQSLP